MIRKRDNLNKQKYCYGNHHCPLTSESIIPLVLLLAVLITLMLQGRNSTTQRREGMGNCGLCGREVFKCVCRYSQMAVSQNTVVCVGYGGGRIFLAPLLFPQPGRTDGLSCLH